MSTACFHVPLPVQYVAHVNFLYTINDISVRSALWQFNNLLKIQSEMKKSDSWFPVCWSVCLSVSTSEHQGIHLRSTHHMIFITAEARVY